MKIIWAKLLFLFGIKVSIRHTQEQEILRLLGDSHYSILLFHHRDHYLDGTTLYSWEAYMGNGSVWRQLPSHTRCSSGREGWLADVNRKMQFRTWRYPSDQELELLGLKVQDE